MPKLKALITKMRVEIKDGLVVAAVFLLACSGSVTSVDPTDFDEPTRAQSALDVVLDPDVVVEPDVDVPDEGKPLPDFEGKPTPEDDGAPLEDVEEDTLPEEVEDDGDPPEDVEPPVQMCAYGGESIPCDELPPGVGGNGPCDSTLLSQYDEDGQQRCGAWFLECGTVQMGACLDNGWCGLRDSFCLTCSEADPEEVAEIAFLPACDGRVFESCTAPPTDECSWLGAGGYWCCPQ